MKSSVMNLITHGVYVIGVTNETTTNLMTAAWAMQISSRPVSIIVAVGKTHFTAELLNRQKNFVLNVLTSNQTDIAKKCGTVSGREVDKSKDINLVLSSNLKQPIIKDCAGWLECNIINSIEYTDHILYIAECINGEVNTTDTLLYDLKK
ncbi:flavin reductase family protein [Megamonas sp.]